MLQIHGDRGGPPGNRHFAHYVDVRDVDALYAELKPKLDTLPAGDVHGPADKPYGQRELLVLPPTATSSPSARAWPERAEGMS